MLNKKNVLSEIGSHKKRERALGGVSAGTQSERAHLRGRVRERGRSPLSRYHNIHVVGISGTEGAAVAAWLIGNGIPFTAHDFSTPEKFPRNFEATHFGLSTSKRAKLFKLVRENSPRIHFEKTYLKGIEKADLIFVSQNWEAYAPNRPLVKIYHHSPALFRTLTQLYFELFPGRILAVTGTNGKSTTTKLIAEILKMSGQKSWFTGNDRRNVQILDCLEKWHDTDWLVVEVSNRQLKFPLGRAPELGVVTNVTKNHLNEYGGSFAKYQAGKFSLIRAQTKQDRAILNYDDPLTRAFGKKVKSTPRLRSSSSGGQALFFSTEVKLPRGVYVDNGWIVYRDEKIERILPVDKIKMAGRHNLSNVLAAVGATRSAGVNPATIRKVVSNFKGLPQRLELVTIKRGVRFVNDTASTTPESTVAALESFPKNSVHLIAGGDPKGMDYATLVTAIQTQTPRSVTLIASPAADILERELKKKRISYTLVKDLKTAVAKSFSVAKKGECTLLSPAAAYFCHFQNKIPLGGRGFELFIRQIK